MLQTPTKKARLFLLPEWQTIHGPVTLLATMIACWPATNTIRRIKVSRAPLRENITDVKLSLHIDCIFYYNCFNFFLCKIADQNRYFNLTPHKKLSQHNILGHFSQFHCGLNRLCIPQGLQLFNCFCLLFLFCNNSLMQLRIRHNARCEIGMPKIKERYLKLSIVLKKILK